MRCARVTMEYGLLCLLKLQNILHFLVLVLVRFKLSLTSARNGNLEVPVYFLKAKQGYIVRKIEKD
jgi:hypothetical protein